jgi:hypothetical protein
VTDYEEYRLHEVNSLQSKYKETVEEYSDAAPVMEQVHKVLGGIVSLAGCTPLTVGEGGQWTSIVESADQGRPAL